MNGSASKTRRLVLVPAVITLAVTLLRLLGELMGWSRALFNPEIGGGGSLVGITWLIPVFGFYFGWKLARSGAQPQTSPGKIIGLSVLALILWFGLGMVVFAILGEFSLAGMVIFCVISIAALPLVRRAWPGLFSLLVTYAFAARIPVVIVMFLAIAGDWGTHYDVPPPDLPAMHWIFKWALIGVLPQMTIWIAFTLIIGAVFGGLALLFAKPSVS